MPRRTVPLTATEIRAIFLARRYINRVNIRRSFDDGYEVRSYYGGHRWAIFLSKDSARTITISDSRRVSRILHRLDVGTIPYRPANQVFVAANPPITKQQLSDWSGRLKNASVS